MYPCFNESERFCEEPYAGKPHVRICEGRVSKGICLLDKTRDERMKTRKKTVFTAALCILALFVAMNTGWYVWRMVKYGAYSKGMEKNFFSTWIVPRYIHTDADGYDYSVKYPGYLSFTGNLSVGLPTTDEEVFTDFLVIWPKFTGGYEYGVSLSEGDEDFQIYIHADGSAVYPEDSEIVVHHQETVDALLQRAEEMWHIKG